MNAHSGTGVDAPSGMVVGVDYLSVEELKKPCARARVVLRRS
jgi:hypothetical protein